MESRPNSPRLSTVARLWDWRPGTVWIGVTRLSPNTLAKLGVPPAERLSRDNYESIYTHGHPSQMYEVGADPSNSKTWLRGLGQPTLGRRLVYAFRAAGIPGTFPNGPLPARQDAC